MAGLLFDNRVYVSDDTAALTAMTFDIDVVKDVYDEVVKQTGVAPRLVSRRLIEGHATPTDTEIPIGDLENLSKSRRRTLLLLSEESEPE